ncbi:MAG TPA: PilZ domain-containing protein [bacterium]|nr:PilZ domain-containing protein [bacterium]
MSSIHQGWMEKRQFERIDATVKVTYCLVPKADLVKILSDPSYRESSADHLPELSKKSATLHAMTRDISMGGMSLVGEQSFPEDSALQIHLHLPGYPAPVTLIAEVIRAQSENSAASGATYRAGIKILAVNRKDVVHLDKYLLAEKLRQRQ